jgi:hypothetical protein
MLQYLAGRGGGPPAMRSICSSLPNEIQSFSLHDKLKPGISADVKRALGVLATMTPPGPTLHLCNVFRIVELRDQIMAGPSAPLARSPSSTRIPAPCVSHPRARALLLLPTSNTLSPNTDNHSVCDVSRHARARTHTRARANSNIDRASVRAEVELHRHVFKPNERPRLQLLALRYGVAVEDIRAANGLHDPSAPVDKKNYLYIPRRRRVVAVQKRTSAPCYARQPVRLVHTG